MDFPPLSYPSPSSSSFSSSFFLLFIALASCQPTHFSLYSFSPDTPSISYLSDASPSRGAIELTLNSATESLQHSTGRALYSRPVHVWTPSRSSPASFNTAFTFAIQNLNSSSFGDGLAFILAPNASWMPSNSYGGWLGLYNEQNDGSAGNHLVAVEFDTYKDAWDPDDNHVGIDVNGIVSNASASLYSKSIILKSDRNITAWIDYDGKQKILQVYVAESSLIKPVGNPVLSYKIDLSTFLLEYMYVGFSAATGLYPETHTLYAWNFSASGLPNTKRDKKLALIGTIILGAIVILALVGAIARKLRKRGDNLEWELVGGSEDWQIQDSDFGPHKLTYKELKRATRNFSPEQKLGQGGFGSVYRGVLGGSKQLVAVKRVSRQSQQGMREFVAEVRIIGRLRHRNLVPLRGWCHDKSELLLVYDYMPNGSLDKMIFANDGKVLIWDRRYKIVCGLAAALLYLHEEWEQQVVHRDVKASNVMLDSEFHARLGDFGLARLIAHDKNAETTIVAGTPGYLAPEYIQTGKATKESDVYSFGAVALEVACGRRPMDSTLPVNELVLVDWVWNLHKEGRLLSAADPKLVDHYNREEMIRLLLVGLACSHPDPSARPSIRQVMEILVGDSRLPQVPLLKPKAHYGPLPPLSVEELVSEDVHSQSGHKSSSHLEGSSSLKSDSSPSLREPLLSEK